MCMARAYSPFFMRKVRTKSPTHSKDNLSANFSKQSLCTPKKTKTELGLRPKTPGIERRCENGTKRCEEAILAH
jgi:hypothetical protein